MLRRERGQARKGEREGGFYINNVGKGEIMGDIKLFY